MGPRRLENVLARSLKDTNVVYLTLVMSNQMLLHELVKRTLNEVTFSESKEEIVKIIERTLVKGLESARLSLKNVKFEKKDETSKRLEQLADALHNYESAALAYALTLVGNLPSLREARLDLDAPLDLGINTDVKKKELDIDELNRSRRMIDNFLEEALDSARDALARIKLNLFDRTRDALKHTSDLMKQAHHEILHLSYVINSTQ